METNVRMHSILKGNGKTQIIRKHRNIYFIYLDKKIIWISQSGFLLIFLLKISHKNTIFSYQSIGS